MRAATTSSLHLRGDMGHFPGAFYPSVRVVRNHSSAGLTGPLKKWGA